MVKECDVLFNNGVVSVIKFGDKKVQIPPVKDGVKKVWVDSSDGAFKVVNKPVKSTVSRETKNVKKVKAVVQDEPTDDNDK